MITLIKKIKLENHPFSVWSPIKYVSGSHYMFACIAGSGSLCFQFSGWIKAQEIHFFLWIEA